MNIQLTCRQVIEKIKYTLFLYKKTWLLSQGKLRRQFILNFKKKNLSFYLNQREGTCLNCGSCCWIVFKCPFVTADNRCKIYTSRFRPRSCALFPITAADTRDVKFSSARSCGYFFDKTEKCKSL